MTREDKGALKILGLFLALGVLYLFCGEARALEYRTFNNTGLAIGGGATTLYASLQGSSSYSSNEARVSCLFPVSADVTALSVWLETAPGSGKSRTFQVRKNGGDQFGCTISNTETSCSNTGSASFAAADLGAVSMDTSGTPASSFVRWSVTISTDSEDQTMFCGSTVGTMLSGSGAYYAFTGMDISPNNDSFNQNLLASTAGTFDNLYVDITAAPGIGRTRTFTVQKNSSPTSVTCSITGTGTTCSDTSNSFTVAAGDDISLAESITGLGSPADANGRFGIRFTSDRHGDVMIAESTPDNVQASGNTYTHLSGHYGNYDTSENAEDYQSGGVIMECYRAYWESNVAPGGFGGAYAMTVRQNGTDTDLTCTISDPSTSCNGDGYEYISSGDTKYAREVDPIGPGTTPVIHGTIVCEVPTRRRW